MLWINLEKKYVLVIGKHSQLWTILMDLFLLAIKSFQENLWGKYFLILYFLLLFLIEVELTYYVVNF